MILCYLSMSNLVKIALILYSSMSTLSLNANPGNLGIIRVVIPLSDLTHQLAVML